jgi:single-stranded-DNA-specific exonuclease
MQVIHSKLVGVSFDGRQDNLRLVQPGFRLFWFHEKDNQYDANAVKVFADPTMRVELGHLKRELAAKVVERIAAGEKLEIFAAQLTGGKKGMSRGVNVKVSLK